MTDRNAWPEYYGYFKVELWSVAPPEIIEWLDKRCDADASKEKKGYVIQGRNVYIKDEGVYTMFLLAWS